MDRRLFAELRRLDRHDLRRVLIFVRGLLLSQGDDFGGLPQGDPGDGEGAVTYRLEQVRCGRPGCTKCPHGPYWYAYFRENGVLRSRYIGRGSEEEAPSHIPPKGLAGP
ncbi:MAG TPA: hypothetical protein VNC78_12245 [Actinomycetota bacterium]|nr:hypothetical protein [Actinomycetota bacterium]